MCVKANNQIDKHKAKWNRKFKNVHAGDTLKVSLIQTEIIIFRNGQLNFERGVSNLQGPLQAEL